MSWWTKSTKRQRGWVKAGEAKDHGRYARREQDEARIEEGLGELEGDTVARHNDIYSVTITSTERITYEVEARDDQHAAEIALGQREPMNLDDEDPVDVVLLEPELVSVACLPWAGPTD